MSEIRSYIEDLHYPEQPARYYIRYGDAVLMLIKNVYRDGELSQLKASAQISIFSVMAFSTVFFARVILAMLSPVIAPLFVLRDKQTKLRYLRKMFYLSSYTYGTKKAYRLIKSKLARWARN